MNDLVLGTGVSFTADKNVASSVIGTSLDMGIRRFDTAPSYGTEQVLGEALIELCGERGINRDEVYLQTKIDAWQMAQGDIPRHVDSALKKLEVDYIDTLLIHWPLPEFLHETWRQMVLLNEEGMVHSIGICNVRMRQLREIETWGRMPDILQIERHPLRTCLEEVIWCRERGITLQAYSPLCKMDSRVRNSKSIQMVSEQHGMGVGEVVLRWHLDSGVVPVFTTSKASRVKDYANVDQFSLDQNEVEMINSVNEDYKMYLESWSCPGF